MIIKIGFKVSQIYFFLNGTYRISDFQQSTQDQSKTTNPFMTDISFDFNFPDSNSSSTSTQHPDPFLEFSIRNVTEGNIQYPISPQQYHQTNNITEHISSTPHTVQSQLVEQRQPLDWSKNANIFRSMLQDSQEDQEEWTDFNSVNEESSGEFSAKLLELSVKFKQAYPYSYELYSHIFDASDEESYSIALDFHKTIENRNCLLLTENIISAWEIMAGHCRDMLKTASELLANSQILNNEDKMLFYGHEKTKIYLKALKTVHNVINNIEIARGKPFATILKKSVFEKVDEIICNSLAIWNNILHICDGCSEFSTISNTEVDFKEQGVLICNLCLVKIDSYDNQIYRASKPYHSSCINIWMHFVGKDIS